MVTKTFCDKCGKELSIKADQQIKVKISYTTSDSILGVRFYDYHPECLPEEMRK